MCVNSADNFASFFFLVRKFQWNSQLAVFVYCLLFLVSLTYFLVCFFLLQLIAVVNQVSTLIGMNQVMCAGHFLYSHVREVSG